MNFSTQFLIIFSSILPRKLFLHRIYAKLNCKKSKEKVKNICGFGPPPIEFDEKLWHAVVDHVTVYNDDRLVFSLKDGSEITVMLLK